MKQREERINFGIINRHPVYTTLLQLAQTGDPNHEKLVQIVRRNRDESQSFGQGQRHILSKCKHALIKGKPA